MIKEVMNNVKELHPLVHCITNKVTINDCANALLAIHASPIMADDENEVEDITSICQSLVINIGTLNNLTIPAMLKAGKKANQLHHPIVLDPVGIGASQWRYQVVQQLLKDIHFSVIKGNASELKILALNMGTTRGVDSLDCVDDIHLDEYITMMKDLSQKTGAIIVMSGAMDIISNERETYIIKNGCPQMSQITGTGCMLSAIIAAYLAANPHSIEAVVYAVALMGYSGELALKRVTQEGKGTGSLHMYLLDYLSLMDSDLLSGGIRVEKKY